MNINNENLCDYGCGKIAKFQMTSGKWCCEEFYSKCPEIKRKNSIGFKNRKNKKVREKPEFCDYGCGKSAKFQFKNGKWCCEEKQQRCQKLRFQKPFL